MPHSTAVDAYNDLCAYTLAHGDPAFIHQHVVDAFAAQTADEHTAPIALTFALVGLHLHVDRHFTGKEVQRVHQRLAEQHLGWPVIPPPYDRGALTASDVMSADEGPTRDKAISNWCAAVWHAYRDAHPTITALLHDRGAA